MRIPILAIHGGAGAIARDAPGASDEATYRAALSAVLLAGQALLREGGSALDAVTEAVRLLEDCELFNAGKGAVYTQAGAHELDASVMDGATLAAGAVANVGRIRNPVLAARAVMERSVPVIYRSVISAERYFHGIIDIVADDGTLQIHVVEAWLRRKANLGEVAYFVR